MHICPVGHESTAADYCDECGRTMPTAGDPSDGPTGSGPGGPGPGGDVLTCRFCATEYTPDDQFCEGCGHELTHGSSGPGGGEDDGNKGGGGQGGNGTKGDEGGNGTKGGPGPTEDPPPPRTVWTARVVPDHDYFLRVLEWDGPDAHSMRFPHEQEPWTLELTGESMRIGRRNSSTSSAPPEIPIGDPGVSRRHAMLLRCGDGTWEVMDLGSANGTTINAGFDRVRRDPVHLKDGDRVHVGAWTTLEIRRVEL
ncbi:FHA domain-containing protein [Embleya sp. NBC_00888]|uniref:FHA domain-containing protein n=1 Tax=Embleya sp. NBC_00888 TaxID=2975960 RepID=UPI00386C939E|nr:FHA domain-containing protein [Embleya sp. NBC_00888]